MIYNVTIDTSTASGKKALQDIRKYRKGVEFENPTISGIPHGYMTGDEFERRVIERLKKSYKDHGLL